MPFSVFRISNKKELYTDLYIKFFNDDIEKKEFLKSTLEKNDELIFLKSDTLINIVTAKVNDVKNEMARSEDVYLEYDELIREFGIELINKEFPNDVVDADFVEKVLEECDKIFEEMKEDYYENYARFESFDHFEGKSDWEISYDEETDKWDKETDGFWRIGDDIG